MVVTTERRRSIEPNQRAARAARRSSVRATPLVGRDSIICNLRPVARAMLDFAAGTRPEGRWFMISRRAILAALLATFAPLASPSNHAHAQALPLPSPKGLISGLDLECYRTPGPELNVELTLRHLNPVLQALGLPPHQVKIKELAQTCVPVRKNNAMPGPLALPFIRHIDFACYRVEADPLPNPIPINLTHLNPVLANLPQHLVFLEHPAQLCLPVAKNGMLPPPEVLALVKFIDLECYQTDPQPHPQFTVGLTQLNPQLNVIPPHPMALDWQQRQLCVPVRKNAQFIPPPFLNLIQWIDLEKFPADPNVQIAPVSVQLQHLNPLFANLPWIPVVLQEAVGLLVPVAKNGAIPPD
jgi:hypothetical protein